MSTPNERAQYLHDEGQPLAIRKPDSFICRYCKVKIDVVEGCVFHMIAIHKDKAGAKAELMLECPRCERTTIVDIEATLGLGEIN